MQFALRQIYSLRRLVRGLASSHDAARQGFAVALTAALIEVPAIESLPALDMLDAALEVTKSMKVQTSHCHHPEETSSML